MILMLVTDVETVYVSDNFEMFVTDSLHQKGRQHEEKAINITQHRHQHHRIYYQFYTGILGT